MFPIRQTARVAPVLATLLAVAACSSSDSTAPDATVAMTQVEANAAADIIINDLADQSEGATATTNSATFFYTAPTDVAFSGAGAPWWAGCRPAPARTVAGSTVTFVFTNCVSARLAPPEKITRNGTVAITAEAGLRRIVFTGFAKEWERISFRTGQVETLTETKDGTRQVTRDDGTVLTRAIYGATTADAFRTVWAAEGATGTHLKRWNAIFTADVPQSIVRDRELPAGKYNITGSSEWTRTRGDLERSWSFQVQTGADGVHYNPACAAAGPNFDSGTVTVVATNRAGVVTTLVITFTGCGQYTTTRS